MVAREKQLVPKDKGSKSACDTVLGTCQAVKGRPNAYFLLFVQSCVRLGKSVWGMPRSHRCYMMIHDLWDSSRPNGVAQLPGVSKTMAIKKPVRRWRLRPA